LNRLRSAGTSLIDLPKVAFAPEVHAAGPAKHTFGTIRLA
jgi:hypothetical protein